MSAKTGAERQPTDLLKLVEKSLDDDKAEDIISIDLAGKSSIADYMVIATGRSARQLNAMAQHLDEKLTKSGVRKVSIEGLTQGEWVLLDGGDVIVHLFKPEVRSFYNLEKMWGADLPEAERITAVG
ncbi:MAG TPA: ribosome silencing factor [Dongiaceae bacterium]|nr:ribosome silencing factor [Dongiaceae bacterium]